MDTHTHTSLKFQTVVGLMVVCTDACFWPVWPCSLKLFLRMTTTPPSASHASWHEVAYSCGAH